MARSRQNSLSHRALSVALALALALPTVGLTGIAAFAEPDGELFDGPVNDAGISSVEGTSGSEGGANTGDANGGASTTPGEQPSAGDNAGSADSSGNGEGAEGAASETPGAEGSDGEQEEPAADGTLSDGESAEADDATQEELTPDDELMALDEGIAPQALTDAQLEPFIVQGLNPENTVVNLFNYSTGKTGTNGSDTLGNTGGASPAVNYQTWLNDPKSINYGHLLTFGDGMRHLGYWNQGIVAAYGDIAYERPGMQNIVAPTLSNGYPSINAAETGEASLGPNGAFLGGYMSNPPLYSEAWRTVKPQSGDPYKEMVYFNAGWRWQTSGKGTYESPDFNPVEGANVTKAVQARAVTPGLPDTDNGESGTYNLTPEQLSLQYLFDPGVTNAGKESYKNVTGLFQVDDEGYYYYNMRKNFAEYVPDSTTTPDGAESDGHFTLYDAPAGLRTDGTNSVGNFFPFNKASEAFTIEDGKLKNVLNANNTSKPFVDHHLGMTLETEFRQPVDGKVAGKPMTFEFVGDDDVWVFIDDVLVLDLGGIHSEIYGTIDFNTGDVNLGTAFNSNGEIYDADGNYITQPKIKTNIKQMFERAGKAGDYQWNGNTFASSTSHTLKMFYLERGNYDSSISVRFNLQPSLYQKIKKVDQNGEPLEGAEFDLYAVETPAGVNLDNAKDVTLEQVAGQITKDTTPVSHVVTDKDGMASFMEMGTSASKAGSKDAFNFADRYNADTQAGLFYILKETKAPTGYKKMPTDLLLRFDPNTTTLIVNNRYQSGSYASFNSYVNGITGSTYYGAIGADGGLVTSLGENAHVPKESQQNGLVVAVPMLKKAGVARAATWLPLYGDNLAGFSSVPYPDDINLNDEKEYRLAIRELTLKAALLQAAEHSNYVNHKSASVAEPWHLSWSEKTSRLEATLENLPGRADRYLNVSPDGDMRMFYAIIEPSALARVLGVSEDKVADMTGRERYEALGAVAAAAAGKEGANSKALDELVAKIGVGGTDSTPGNGADGRGYSPLDSREFVRNFRSVLYIPNERRSLRVVKVDQNGQRVQGVRFGLYETEAQAKEGGEAGRLSVGETDKDGLLIFEPLKDGDVGKQGLADMQWEANSNADLDDAADAVATFYLKEIGAPGSFTLNETVVPVKVGVYSIYADAGEVGDGVSVMAGVGKLNQSMIKYASDGDVNITLRDITAFAQSQPSGKFTMKGWTDEALKATGQDKVLRSMNLHYGINKVIDYGLSDADGGKVYEPFFVTDTGYIRTRVQQNLDEHTDPSDPFYSTANADKLGDMDITGLFSLINTVVVTDRDEDAPAAGKLSISKTVEGSKVTPADYDRLFNFKVELLGADGRELTGEYNFYGTERAGSMKSGDVLPLHHDEEVVILGVPEGTTWRVTETDADKDGFWVVGGATHEGTIVKDETASAAFVNSTEKPKDPEDPEGPGGPGTPTEPGDDGPGGSGGSGGDDGPGGDGKGDNPADRIRELARTGDALPLALLAALALAAAATAAMAQVMQARQRHRARAEAVRVMPVAPGGAAVPGGAVGGGAPTRGTAAGGGVPTTRGAGACGGAAAPGGAARGVTRRKSVGRSVEVPRGAVRPVSRPTRRHR